VDLDDGLALSAHLVPELDAVDLRPSFHSHPPGIDDGRVLHSPPQRAEPAPVGLGGESGLRDV
jgi:hypothetical protein